MTELEKRCVDALAKAQGLDPHEIAALPISTATGNLLDEVRAVLAEAGVAELVGAARDVLPTLNCMRKQGIRVDPDQVDALESAVAKIGANQ